MRCNLTMQTALFLTISAALVIARPSPEAEGGYSYTPPSGYGGARFNHQQAPSWSPDSRARASEVTVEQVPIRLVQQSSEINRQMAFPSAPNRGAYYFPSQRQQQQQQQFPQQYFRSEHAEQFNRNSNQYRQNDAPQQRGAYVFPPAQRGGFTPMFQPQYERQQQARHFRFNNHQGRSDNQYRTINNNNFYDNYRNYPANSNNNNLNFNPSNNFNPTLGNNSPTFINNFPPNNQYQGQNNQNQGQNYPNQGHGQNNGNGYNGQNNGNNGQNNGNNGQNYGNNGQGYGNNGQNHGNNHNQQSTPGNFPSTSNGNQPTPTQGYNYVAPNGPNMEANLNTTDGATGNLTDLGPRITIAISKSTVIHTGKGSYKIDEKTGLPQPLIAEAHSYAGLPDPNEKSKTNDSDNLTGEGTGNIPIISRGTPPEDEENQNTVDEESETEANTEEPDTTEAPEEQPTTPAPPAPTVASPQQQPLYTNAWPLKSYGGYHAHVVVAPGQTQFFALGTSTPAHQAYYYAPNQYVTPYAVQPTAAGQYYTAQPLYAQQYGAYHPSVLARSSASPFASFLPYIVQDPALVNSAYGAFSPIYTHDDRQDKALENAEPAAAPENPTEEVEPQQQQLEQPETQQFIGRRIIDMGGVAVAGPGGVADAGRGGTAIVGPGGTAYSSPTGVSVVGPGGKVLLQGANSETILAKGPVIYYHNA